MDKATYTKAERVWLKASPVYNEKWVQDRIAEDPSLLGLGDLVLKDKERRQPNAGRFDLLLQDADSGLRYEVEVQPGKTDASHIIRTIEYWDIECERYPQYDHYPVIVAEEITGRFFNVIHQLNRAIPLIAIQMNARKVGEHVTLVFVKTVPPRPKLALEEEDAGLDLMDYDSRHGRYRIRLAPATLEDYHVLIQDVMKQAYQSAGE